MLLRGIREIRGKRSLGEAGPEATSLLASFRLGVRFRCIYEAAGMRAARSKPAHVRR